MNSTLAHVFLYRGLIIGAHEDHALVYELGRVA